MPAKLLIGFLLGVLLGLVGHYGFPIAAVPSMRWVTDSMTLVGSVWLRIIFMVVVPLIGTGLVLGVFELSKGRNLGKVALRSITYTLLFSLLAVLIAVGLTTFLKPGTGITFDRQALAQNQSVIAIQKSVAVVQAKPWFQFFVDLLPQNPLDAAVRAFQGEIISFMFFCLFFGYALSLVESGEDSAFIRALGTIFETCLKVIEIGMKLAPVAIFCIIFKTVYALGAGFLGNVALFTGTVVLGLLIQQFVVYAGALAIFGRTNPWEFFRKCKEVYLYAFSTASSNATLPIALEAAEHVLKLPPRISRFVLTVGASANQNGSALFEGVTVLFLAQVYGIHLSFESQLVVVLMSVLASIGTAGVPGGSLPIIVVLMVQVGIPAEGIGLILGVDRFLDMCRTTLNVSGDLVIAKLVSVGTGNRDAGADGS
ncbi:MAG: dicarboxylate/amino acid:cation symporter [Geothrix sp.]|nr:dicarboxylate/amino acid:cation symporter [Geothrix sp.]